jgi:uncharacterized membrane protein YkvA (DUF1232 family)
VEGSDNTTAKPSNPDFYQKQRGRLRSWLTSQSRHLKYAELVLLAPDLLHVLVKLGADRRVSPMQRAKLAATIAYFVAPIGLVPEALVGPIGYVDDVALAAYVLNGMLNSDQAHLVHEHWAGDGDILNIVQGVLEVADSAIGSGLWRRLDGLRLPRWPRK